MERKWQNSGLTSHYLEIESIRSAYFACIIQEHQCNPRHLFKNIGGLLKVNGGSVFTNQLCNYYFFFLEFFTTKIANAHKQFSVLSSPNSSHASVESFPCALFSNFVQHDFASLVTVVSNLKRYLHT